MERGAHKYILLAEPSYCQKSSPAPGCCREAVSARERLLWADREARQSMECGGWRHVSPDGSLAERQGSLGGSGELQECLAKRANPKAAASTPRRRRGVLPRRHRSERASIRGSAGKKIRKETPQPTAMGAESKRKIASMDRTRCRFLGWRGVGTPVGYVST